MKTATDATTQQLSGLYVKIEAATAALDRMNHEADAETDHAFIIIDRASKEDAKVKRSKFDDKITRIEYELKDVEWLKSQKDYQRLKTKIAAKWRELEVLVHKADILRLRAGLGGPAAYPTYIPRYDTANV